MMLFERNGVISSVTTKARQVADVSGAGDTAIATLAATMSGGADIREASVMANYAAGIVCEKPGIVSIDIDELIESIWKNR
jgi:D-beta-D-heptose 7-phosphate kinase/D-beta-D-heptose 1-phosphate adenosyltransferase